MTPGPVALARGEGVGLYGAVNLGQSNVEVSCCPPTSLFDPPRVTLREIGQRNYKKILQLNTEIQSAEGKERKLQKMYRGATRCGKPVEAIYQKKWRSCSPADASRLATLMNDTKCCVVSSNCARMAGADFMGIPALEFKGIGKRKNFQEKPANQRHRPARFLHVKIWVTSPGIEPVSTRWWMTIESFLAICYPGHRRGRVAGGDFFPPPSPPQTRISLTLTLRRCRGQAATSPRVIFNSTSPSAAAPEWPASLPPRRLSPARGDSALVERRRWALLAGSCSTTLATQLAMSLSVAPPSPVSIYTLYQLVRSYPTKANRVQSPAGSLRIFVSGNRAERCHWSVDFLGDLPFPPPFHSGAAPYSLQSPSSAIMILAVTSRPNIFTHSHYKSPSRHSTGGKWGRARKRDPQKALSVLQHWTAFLLTTLSEAMRADLAGCAQRENPENTRRPVASSGVIPTSEDPEANQTGNQTQLALVGGELLTIASPWPPCRMWVCKAGKEGCGRVCVRCRRVELSRAAVKGAGEGTSSVFVTALPRAQRASTCVGGVVWTPVGTPRPRSRSEGAIRATLTRTSSASSLLRARRTVLPTAPLLDAKDVKITDFTRPNFSRRCRDLRRFIPRWSDMCLQVCTCNVLRNKSLHTWEVVR
ncbi:hypothetical protein PR048_009476 [Dryococelus australis]|uniref:Ribosomal protein L22 n=1 Tax=Dryococelus australis TaxID=614101 RepID=A0ABQ9I0Q9_9NEOP|nr:hypothetical protein PR048_009476 [Dryococelus australis]